MAEDEQVLQLSTLRVRRQIEVDGERYELLDAEELSLVQSIQLQRLAADMAALGKGGQSDESQIERLAVELWGAVRQVVVGLPDEKNKALTDLQRCKVIEVFCKAPGAPAPAGATPSRPENF